MPPEPVVGPATTHDGRPLAAQRQTRLGLYVTAKEAYALWQADPGRVRILDVRTPEEWVFTGHAPMAINVPVMFQAYVWDDDHNGFAWDLNPEFVQRVRERVSPAERILVACRSGGRGAMAVNTLAGAGFTNVYNVIDGMEGDRIDDPDDVFHGMRVVNGWKAAGLPWTYEPDPDRMAVPDREPWALYPGNEFD